MMRSYNADMLPEVRERSPRGGHNFLARGGRDSRIVEDLLNGGKANNGVEITIGEEKTVFTVGSDKVIVEGENGVEVVNKGSRLRLTCTRITIAPSRK